MRRIMYLTGSCLVALLLAIGVTAFLQKDNSIAHASQPIMGDGTWTVFTTAHGLPSDRVKRVVVDDSGQVWAGFQKGSLSNPYNEIISRLDGDTWVNYYLPGCSVEPLLATDTIYAGTHCPGPHANQGYGLHWFVEDAWISFTPGDGMQGTYLRGIATEGDSKVWFSAGNNDICFNYVNLLDHKGTADKADDEWTVYDFNAIWGLCAVYGIGIDPAGNRWFGTSGGIWVLTVDETWLMYFENDGDDFAFDNQGNTWVSYTDFITMFDGTTWVSYPSQEEAIEANYAAVMNTLNRRWVQGVNDGLWVVEEPAGVWVKNNFEDVRFYDGQNWTTYDPSNSGLGSYFIEGMTLDYEGNIWVATDIGANVVGGLYKFTPFPDYSLQAAPNTIFLEQGQDTIVNVSVNRLRGLVPTTTLSISGLPTGVLASFENNPVTPTAQVQLTLTSSQTTQFGTYNLNLMATTNDGLSRIVNLTLYVVEEAFYTYLPVIYKP